MILTGRSKPRYLHSGNPFDLALHFSTGERCTIQAPFTFGNVGGLCERQACLQHQTRYGE
jgi:hypothetical protein